MNWRWQGDVKKTFDKRFFFWHQLYDKAQRHFDVSKNDVKFVISVWRLINMSIYNIKFNSIYKRHQDVDKMISV